MRVRPEQIASLPKAEAVPAAAARRAFGICAFVQYRQDDHGCLTAKANRWLLS